MNRLNKPRSSSVTRSIVALLCLISVSLLSSQLAAGEETSGLGFALENGDTNGDLKRDVSDGIYLLNFLFQSGVSPPAPYPLPGLDPTPDSMLCAQR